MSKIVLIVRVQIQKKPRSAYDRDACERVKEAHGEPGGSILFLNISGGPDLMRWQGKITMRFLMMPGRLLDRGGHICYVLLIQMGSTDRRRNLFEELIQENESSDWTTTSRPATR